MPRRRPERRAAGIVSALCVGALCASAFCASALAAPGAVRAAADTTRLSEGPAGRDPAAAAAPSALRVDSWSAGLEEIVAGHNANIRAAMALIETLSVEQEVIEPADDGRERRAMAVLTYRRGDRMRRRVLSSDLAYPSGRYRLESLVGPELLPEEYDITLAGVDTTEGRACYALSVAAVERDTDHFDGTVWVTVEGFHLVRIRGEVADPPFPVVRATLDKAFEPGPGGFWLLRRHTGWVEARLGFARRQGTRHIFYTRYTVRADDRLTE